MPRMSYDGMIMVSTTFHRYSDNNKTRLLIQLRASRSQYVSHATQNDMAVSMPAGAIIKATDIAHKFAENFEAHVL